jgi:hypothetical protein
MMGLGTERERIVTVAPFGFQLWDAVEGRTVAAGMRVSGRGPRGSIREATVGPSGVFSIRHSPAAWPTGAEAGGAAFWASPPPYDLAWSVDVDDPSGRFAPFSFEVDRAIRIGRTAREVCGIDGMWGPGLGVIGATSPPEASRPEAAMPILPLFSAPARPWPSGAAAVTVQLETTDGRAVPFAVVEVVPAGARTAYGLTDARGVAIVLLPYPELEDGHGSPPPATRRPLHEQSWRVGIRVFATPWATWPARPDLCDVLGQLDDPPARLMETDSSVATVMNVTLEYGRPLGVQTAGHSVLVLDAGPPPSP